MDIKDDYINFSLENGKLLSALEDKETLTFDLLQPVIEVLNFLNEKDMQVEGETRQDCIDVFSIGFKYLYTEIENIKRILSDYFEDDIDELIEFDQNVYLYIRCDEIDTLADSNNDLISGLLDRLDQTFEYKSRLGKKEIEAIEKEFDKALQRMDEVTAADQFMDFADSLGIDLI